jgi:2,3-bisphosphoglycerate-independent phosphoglycerate mutase
MARIVAEVVSEAGMTMFRTAETEKYAHVTYFFNGGFEPPYRGEERVLVPSQKVATYDLAPEMSAAGVTDVLTKSMGSNNPINVARATMEGLEELLTPERAARERGITVEELGVFRA